MSTTELELTTAPFQVAHDTFVIPQLMQAPPVGYLYLNSLVIKGDEPVVVDTGTPSYRDRWFAHVTDLVDPEDVKWIFLTHDDRDHSGNLVQAMEAFPNATLLTTWFAVGRMEEEWSLPMDRVRFLNDGEHLDLPDRTLLAVRPPLFDNPTTRGLFDSATGVYWSVDSFVSLMPHAMENVDEWDERGWREAMELGNRLLAPWHAWLDARKWNQHVDRSASLPIKTIASCHAPAITGARVGAAYEALRRLPEMAPWPEPTMEEFGAWMEAAHVRAGAGELPVPDPRNAFGA